MMLLEIEDLTVTFDTPGGDVRAVDGVSLSVPEGGSVALVGESGSGKSQTAFSVLGLLARNGRAAGAIRWGGEDILNAPERRLRALRGDEIGIVFQDPMTSLNPFMRIGAQLAETLTEHRGISRREAEAEAVRMLDAVRIPDARARLRQHPHEFSGGMRQRVMIAMALLNRPRLLIADEPTTALDVTVQAQIMELLADLRAEFGMALLLITHDLGIVAGACERTVVMYGGRAMEAGPTADLFADPAHPYTAGLLAAVPRIDGDGDLSAIPGDPPDMSRPIPGCPFTPRCPLDHAPCPARRPAFDGRRACHAPVADVRALARRLAPEAVA
ncbi:MAG: ABC transporter ATP-binding protein [Hasllibacter sp.]